MTVLVMGLLAGVAEAQTSGSQSARSTSVSSPGSSKHKKSGKAKIAPSERLDYRKDYHWKDGQKATPSGHEAAPTNGSYQSP